MTIPRNMAGKLGTCHLSQCLCPKPAILSSRLAGSEPSFQSRRTGHSEWGNEEGDMLALPHGPRPSGLTSSAEPSLAQARAPGVKFASFCVFPTMVDLGAAEVRLLPQ